MMRPSLLLLPLAALAVASPLVSRAQKDVLEAQEAYARNTETLLRQSQTGCTSKEVRIRRAWDDLSELERKNYLDSVGCLLEKKPARSDPKLVPGARTWNDDFVWSHMSQTNFIHASGLFLPWHRQLLWAYEQTLRDECGYRGALPYWPWERHSADQSKSPVFQPASFGTNGEYVPQDEASIGHVVGLPSGYNFTFQVPIGTGGGCLRDGVFKDIVLNLGPVSGLETLKQIPDNTYGNRYNPRCLTRNLTPDVSAVNLTYSRISRLWSTRSIREFRPQIETLAHPNSHAYIGGENLDFYSSINDPVFYLLHAQVDRLWTVWQGQDYASRRLALDGTVTVANLPPSENATLSTVMHMGVAGGGDVPISQAMSPIENQYCYMYL